MYWDVVDRGRVLLSVGVSSDFFAWLRARVTDSEVARFDPFRNDVLDLSMQRRWQTALAGAREELVAETRVSAAEGSRLPQAAEARAMILDRLTEQRLAKMPFASVLDELLAVLELGIEESREIRITGD